MVVLAGPSPGTGASLRQIQEKRLAVQGLLLARSGWANVTLPAAEPLVPLSCSLGQQVFSLSVSLSVSLCCSIRRCLSIGLSRSLLLSLDLSLSLYCSLSISLFLSISFDLSSLYRSFSISLFLSISFDLSSLYRSLSLSDNNLSVALFLLSSPPLLFSLSLSLSLSSSLSHTHTNRHPQRFRTSILPVMVHFVLFHLQ